MNKLHKEAINALLCNELEEHGYEDDFQVSHDYDDVFEVEFPNHGNFNSISIKVKELDKSSPKSSKFLVHVYEDSWAEFRDYDWSIKELWKAILWK